MDRQGISNVKGIRVQMLFPPALLAQVDEFRNKYGFTRTAAITYLVMSGLQQDKVPAVLNQLQDVLEKSEKVTKS